MKESLCVCVCVFGRLLCKELFIFELANISCFIDSDLIDF